MPSLNHASKSMSKQWLQSVSLHGVLLLSAVLYHLHRPGSLHPSANSMDKTGTTVMMIVSDNSMDILELSTEHYAMTESQEVDAKPKDVLVEAAIDVATETPLEGSAQLPINVSKQLPIAALKELRPTAAKVATTKVLTANKIQSTSATRRAAVKPVQTARPDHAYSPKPAYPLALRDLGVSGVVWLRVWVDDTGRPQEIEVSKGSGYRLFDEAALRAVQQWRFIPATNEQQSLASWVEFAVRFELNG